MSPPGTIPAARFFVPDRLDRSVRAEAPKNTLSGKRQIQQTPHRGTTPLSPNAALHVSWIGRSDLTFLSGSQYVVEKINRRIAQGAARFVFAGTADADVNALTT